MVDSRYRFYEFFAGGGMAAIGLGAKWRATFANDLDGEKARAYAANHDPAPFVLADVANLQASALPGQAELAWASSPCQDLSLAGLGKGLNGARSGAFWGFWRLMEGLAAADRAPTIIAVENVYGAVAARSGKDLCAMAEAFANLGYRFGAVIIDAAHFVPQSRPRLFMIGVRSDAIIPVRLINRNADAKLEGPWSSPALTAALAQLPPSIAARTVSWRLPQPPPRRLSLIDVINLNCSDWNDASATARLIDMMDENNRAKLNEAAARAKSTGATIIGTVFRRTRPSLLGKSAQRAEVRFDGLAGCLRTPAGGSSRQTIIAIDSAGIRSRLLSPRETARLMGLSDSYRLPERASAAYQLTGDGVVAPVVRFLADALFEPIIEANRTRITGRDQGQPAASEFSRAS